MWEQINHRENNGRPYEVVTYAKQLIGAPYIYGADGPFAFDCSGFTLYVYKHAGIILPHNAAMQSKVGWRVKQAKLSPGDLLFFNTTGKGVSHTGIYLGKKEFIHASSAEGKVIISSMYNNYYQRHFVTARRINGF